ncbi:TPA: hypothetical protein ACG9WV_003039, partial [Enterococcus faecium]|nr:hypothetical protein [Enterococcus faecium]HAP7431750.1 hypothetical protein [Enterococcus faecium]HAQ1977365.1 hypothetical protein [Enterococcus faecium]HAQ2327496.1 hypothetical protein [Enterococcus faecium]HBB8267269.1 hypothetical protein [Enterococcus faecium]
MRLYHLRSLEELRKLDFNKKFFWEISDLSCFVESERLSNGNNSVLNEYDKVVINKVKSLCEEARESISHINGSNFKQTLFNLIKLDAKISSYLFFLIHDEFMDYQKLDQLIERESWEDYYVGLTFSEKLNNYKLIDYKYL